MYTATQAFNWENLLEYIDQGSVIPIIGQDLLTIEIDGKQLSFQQYLAAQLSAKLGIIPPKDDLNAVAMELRGRHPAEIVHTPLNALLKRTTIPVPEPLRKLAEILPFKLFVSLSFDSYLEQALNLVRYGGELRTELLINNFTNYDDLQIAPIELNTPVVYHLFGKASPTPDDYAVTDENYIEFLVRLQSERPERLFDEFERSHLLILGCSFPDWLARFFFRTIKRHPLSQPRQSGRFFEFVADEYIGNKKADSSNLVVFLEHFSDGTRLYTENGANEFVSELHRRWKLSPSSAQIPRPDIERGFTRSRLAQDPKDEAIFLSYVREDAESVKRIRKILKECGLSVWFDEDRLDVGENFRWEIEEKINRCAFFLPVISENALSKKESFFYREWSLAIDRSKGFASERKYIMPLIIDEVGADDSRIPREFRCLHTGSAPRGELPKTFVDNLVQEFRKLQKEARGRV